MVRHVSVCDVMENLVQDPVIPINGGQSPPQPIPLRRVIVRQRRVGVLQERDQDKKPIHDEQRYSIDTHNPSQPLDESDPVEHIQCPNHANVGDEDLEPLTSIVYRAVRIVVAREAIIGPTGDVEGQVQRPPESEGNKQGHEPTRWVVQVLGVPRDFGLRLGDEDLVPVEGPSVGVVPPVTIFPGEVWDEERGVEDEADGVINPLIITKCMMAAFMGDDPNSGANRSLYGPVEAPCKVGVGGGEEGDVCGGDVVEGSDDDEVVDDVGEGSGQGAVEAVGRDGLLDVAECERRLRNWDPLERVLLRLDGH